MVGLLFKVILKLYLTNFSSKEKALNNLSNFASILVTEAIGDIDKSKALVIIGWSGGPDSCEESVVDLLLSCI